MAQRRNYKIIKERYTSYLSNVNFNVNALDLYQLTSAEANIYSLAKSYWKQKQDFYMSSRNIAITLNLSERYVQKSIKNLEKKGYIVIEKRSNNVRVLRKPTTEELYKKATGEYKNLFNEINEIF